MEGTGVGTHEKSLDSAALNSLEHHKCRKISVDRVSAYYGILVYGVGERGSYFTILAGAESNSTESIGWPTWSSADG
jgi:hypothetical protein